MEDQVILDTEYVQERCIKVRTIDGLNIVVILFVYHCPSNPIVVFHHFRGLMSSIPFTLTYQNVMDNRNCTHRQSSPFVCKKNPESIGAYF